MSKSSSKSFLDSESMLKLTVTGARILSSDFAHSLLALRDLLAVSFNQCLDLLSHWAHLVALLRHKKLDYSV